MAQNETQEATQIKQKLKKPKKWKVILLNDDTTPIDFVSNLLESVFNHDATSASAITMLIHETGSGLAGIYQFEIAEEKAIEATTSARNANFPLQVKLEPEA